MGRIYKCNVEQVSITYSGQDDACVNVYVKLRYGKKIVPLPTIRASLSLEEILLLNSEASGIVRLVWYQGWGYYPLQKEAIKVLLPSKYPIILAVKYWALFYNDHVTEVLNRNRSA